MRVAMMIVYSLLLLFFVLALAYNQYLTYRRSREKPFDPWNPWDK